MQGYTRDILILNKTKRDEFFSEYDRLIEEWTIGGYIDAALDHQDNYDRLLADVSRLDRKRKTGERA